MSKNINIENYEMWMVDYVEGNLSKTQQEQLQQFLLVHPELQAELDIFRQTVLQPDMHVVFENKDLLKKQETTKVIGIRTWQKYSIGIAAALLLFAGIKFSMPDNANVSGLRYSAREISKPDFAFVQKIKDDSLNLITEKSDERHPEIYFAEQKKNRKEKQTDQSPDEKNKLQQNLQPIIDLPTESMEFALIRDIDVVKHKGRIEREVSESYVNYADINFIHPHSEKENNSIIDKYNNTLGFAETVGNMLGITRKDDNSRNESDQYKETHIKIFDIEYYNRKKTDK